jgi:hypothetical protein
VLEIVLDKIVSNRVRKNRIKIELEKNRIEIELEKIE